ncbi:MAG: 50S ribosomal protein L3 [Elusimicrobia bacterium]|nr:50S ribosomal protein L3 [Elusimicrobiota bacterium]MDE2236999.1 50S ribosomal protein L3 [Elusimicrobiota bacterium]MDE2425310.1 50S ribosomal protein L3 [Elusimicrobiota bacterium]
MAEEEAVKPVEADGAKKAPATFRAILGEKVGMTQVFHPKDRGLYDVTVVKAGPCRVLRVKTADSKDGYNAVQLAYGVRKEKNVPAPLRGQFKKAGVAPARFVKEIRLGSVDGLEAGQVVTLETGFKPGDYVDIQGVSKGKGFAGVMKRHNFRGLPGSHGASDKERSPGSLASRRSLGRVLPGQRMAGRMGHETTTMQKLEIVQIDPQNGLIYVNGSVPGPKGGFVTIHETVKAKKFRAEARKPTVRKDKMGNIIKAAAPKAGAKK